jgi:hypothetical protein
MKGTILIITRPSLFGAVRDIQNLSGCGLLHMGCVGDGRNVLYRSHLKDM